ncbi:MAG: hypothetical protein JWQ44_1973 [Chthoniobacter sp.]|jgi:hypothetical protein|nr:hypothetical protein [Chthoniobacter sp.]
MNTEEHDELWQLLGKARAPRVSPFFSRNVLRAVREEQPGRSGRFGWFHRGWQITALGACAVVIAGAVFLSKQAEAPDPVSLLASQVTVSPDYHVIGHLDELLDSELNSVWLDTPAY